jgi:hypothetical protein
MRGLYPIIEARRDRYSEHPFIRFLRDTTLSPERRLSYAPFCAHWVLTFAEINRRFLRDPHSDDPWQAIVNRHAEEDAKHWSWFLRDLKTLGYDTPCTFVDALRFVWSDEGWHTREMGYYTIGVARDADPRLRVAIVETLESMGNVWLEATLVAAREHPAADRLVYFGTHHLERETGHAIGTSTAAVEALELPESLRATAESAVHGLYDRMERFNEEILARAHSTYERHGMNREGALAQISPEDVGLPSP